MAEATRPWYRRLWDGWMVVARAIGNFNARLLLSLFYFLIILPLGLITGAAKDFLGIRRPTRLAPLRRAAGNINVPGRLGLGQVKGTH